MLRAEHAAEAAACVEPSGHSHAQGATRSKHARFAAAQARSVCLRQLIKRHFEPARLRFPGFFVHHARWGSAGGHFAHGAFDDTHLRQGVPDGLWVEVMRIERFDDLEKEKDICAVGQVGATLFD